MPLTVNFPVAEKGNTVPYPPLRDKVRNNHGFVDLRGKPGSVSIIPEASASPALHILLTRASSSDSHLMTLGCDLGEHVEDSVSLDCRKVAGGYVQLTTLPLLANDEQSDNLFRLCKNLEACLSNNVSKYHWRVDFELSRTAFVFEETIEAHSIWIWFFALASTKLKARASREKLLLSLSAGLS